MQNLIKGAHNEVFGVRASDIYTNVCFYPDSSFIGNVEETLMIEDYSSPFYYIDLLSSNFMEEE